MGALKKLLIITDWFAPGYKAGGPIQSCVNLCAALTSNYDFYVLTTDTDHGETKPYPGIEPDKWLHNAAAGHQYMLSRKKNTHNQKDCKRKFN